MQIIRPSSYEEYISWYLRRECSKRGGDPDGDLSFPTISSMRDEMNNWHSGKLREFFKSGMWHIVLLNKKDEIDNLVCLEGDWTKECQLLGNGPQGDVRTLTVFTSRAEETKYFSHSKSSPLHNERYERMLKYFSDFQKNPPVFQGDDRITICTLSEGEKRQNPSGTYYLHDGLGRLLPYHYLLESGKVKYHPIEAFLVEEVPS